MGVRRACTAGRGQIEPPLGWVGQDKGEGAQCSSASVGVLAPSGFLSYVPLSTLLYEFTIVVVAHGAPPPTCLANP